eukprot:2183172-Pleurochrysis_carterae.AAC.3
MPDASSFVIYMDGLQSCSQVCGQIASSFCTAAQVEDERCHSFGEQVRYHHCGWSSSTSE